MKFTCSDYLDGDCTRKEFLDQYNPISLEVGKVYIQDKGTWSEMHYKIIFNDGKMSLGIKVHSAISNEPRYLGDYELFYSDNGFKYKDILRPSYRLSEEVKQKGNNHENL